jgi:hypothetical protein
MLKLPFRTWVRNAAAVFSQQRGAVTQQAADAGCSRQTVYAHARHLDERLPQLEAELAQVRADKAALQQRLAAAQQQLAQRQPDLRERLPRFAVTAQAMGISLRQAEELLGTLLPPEHVPDHATLGRWTRAAAVQAGRVLAALDPRCPPLVHTACVDEIFFGG